MSDKFTFARHHLLFLVVWAFLALLPSCSTSPNASKQLSPPPPPYIPFETEPGEASNIGKVLKDIKGNPHIPGPRSRPSASPSRYPNNPEYPATLTIYNQTDCTLGFYLQGPVVRQFGIAAGKLERVDIRAGSYTFGFDTHLCAGNVPRLYGNDVFKGGRSYELFVSKEDLRTDTGSLDVQNETGANLRIRIGNVDKNVAQGSLSIPLREGSYTAVVTARCGTRRDPVTISKGSSTALRYWCSGGVIESRTMGSGDSVGYFDIDNSTGKSLTVRVGNRSYKVQPGSMTIELPEGTYKATVSAWCGSSTDNVTIQEGSRYTGLYSCVSY